MADRGMRNAALPTITKPNMIELNAIDLPGLHIEIRKNQLSIK